MQVRLRLARAGQKHRPFYRIVAMQTRKRRDAQPLERLGTYDPLPDRWGQKHIALNTKRIEHWIMRGAQPTEPVMKILSWAQVLPPYPRRGLPAQTSLQGGEPAPSEQEDPPTLGNGMNVESSDHASASRD